MYRVRRRVHGVTASFHDDGSKHVTDPKGEDHGLCRVRRVRGYESATGGDGSGTRLPSRKGWCTVVACDDADTGERPATACSFCLRVSIQSDPWMDRVRTEWLRVEWCQPQLVAAATPVPLQAHPQSQQPRYHRPTINPGLMSCQ